MERSGAQPLVQALVLATCAALVGLVVNELRPSGLPLDRPILAASGGDVACAAPEGGASEVDLSRARDLQSAGAIFVDARPAGDFTRGHVPGAIHLPSAGECPGSEATIASLRSAAVPVVVYDDGGTCDLARRLAARLASEGIAEVHLLLGGFSGWSEAGVPAERGACPSCDLPASKEEER